MDALDARGRRKYDTKWPILPVEQASSSTPSPTRTLTAHGEVQVGSLSSLQTIPSFLTHISGASGDLEDDTLDYSEVTTRSAIAVSPSPPLKFPKISYSPAFATKHFLDQSYFSFESTICQRSFPDLLDLSLGGGIPISKCSLVNSKPCNGSNSPDQSSRVEDIVSKVSTPPYSILAYDLVGTVGRGHDKKVLLSRKGNSKGKLYALKTIGSHAPSSSVKELALLRFLTQTLNVDQSGALFLQTLVDDFRDDNFFYTILEYYPTTLSTPDIAMRFRIRGIQHTTLAAYISNTDRSPISCSADSVIYKLQLLLAEICLGLLYLHEHGIVHQDIKPRTIMVSNTGHIAIGDFGAASRLPIRNLEISHSCSPNFGVPGTPKKNYGPIILQPSDLITFTPLYAAPELRHRNHAGLVVYDERVDWWAVGVLVYELITGIAPSHLSLGLSGYGSGAEEWAPLGGPSNARETNTFGEWYLPLKDFLDSLLCHDPTTRLSGHGVKGHPFFASIFGLWPGIAALKYPPCPKPSTFDADQGASFDSGSKYGSLPPQYVLNSHNLDSDESCPFGTFGIPSTETCTQVSPLLTDGHSVLYREPEKGQEPNRWRLTHSYEESDHGSEIQALPSTASIYFNINQGTLDNTLVSDNGGNAMDLPENVPFDSIQELFLRGRFISQYSSDLELNGPFNPYGTSSVLENMHQTKLQDGSTGSYSTRERFSLTYDSPVSLTQVSPEKITLSLLEAMDNRDRREKMYRQYSIKKPHKITGTKNNPTQAPQMLIKTIARRVLKGARFW